jgi:NhaP-type Na+/H+ or K+/H+ antiporter
MMDPYILLLAGFGGVVLLTAWLPMVLKELPLSLPIICVALGALPFGMFNYGDAPAPQAHLHGFVEQIERLLMMNLLVLFGGALAVGGVLRDLSWTLVSFAVLTLLIVRPLVAWISVIGRKEPATERAIIAFFGIRGIGSVYYLAYALGRAPMEDADLLWTAASLVILISIGLDGMTVAPVMHILDRRRRR